MNEKKKKQKFREDKFNFKDNCVIICDIGIDNINQ